LLSELREKMLRNLTIHVQLQELSTKFVEKLMEVVKENSKHNPRTCDLHLNVFDRENNMNVKMPSRKFRIHPDNSFLETLTSMPEIADVKYNDH